MVSECEKWAHGSGMSTAVGFVDTDEAGIGYNAITRTRTPRTRTQTRTVLPGLVSKELLEPDCCICSLPTTSAIADAGSCTSGAIGTMDEPRNGSSFLLLLLEFSRFLSQATDGAVDSYEESRSCVESTGEECDDAYRWLLATTTVESPLTFDEGALRGIGDSSLVHEVHRMRQSLMEAYKAMRH